MKKTLLSLLLLASAGLSAQWTEQATGFTTPNRGISEIYAVDPNVVWALAYDGVTPTNIIYDFTRTTNGGTTWTPGTVQVGAGLTLTNLSPVSATTAWAGAFNATAGLGGVWKTTNGGVSWTEQNAAAYNTAGLAWFNFVHFFNETHGVTQGDPVATDFEVYYTTDGGATWSVPPPFPMPNPLDEEYGYNGGYAAAGNSLWFVTNKGRIYRTTDMGVNWTVHQSPITDFGSAAVNGKLYVSDDNTGVILATSNSGASYQLYTSTNLGSATPTWSAGTAYTGGQFRDLSYIPNTSAIVAVSAAAGTGGSKYSTNNGQTFTNIDTGVQRTAVDFVNGTTGWSGGFNASSTEGGIYKYTGAALRVDSVEMTSLAAYPNPTNGRLTISGAPIQSVVVMDLLGKQVLAAEFTAVNDAEIDLSGLQVGAYLVKATSDTGAVQTIKIMKN